MTNKELIAKLQEISDEEVEVMVSSPGFFGPVDLVFGTGYEIIIHCSENFIHSSENLP